ALAQPGHDREAAVVDHPLQARHLLGLDLVDQLGPDPQPRGAGRLLPGPDRDRGAGHLADQVARRAAGHVGVEADLVARPGRLAWQPGAEEVMLGEGDPGVAVERLGRTVLVVLEPAPQVALGIAEPGRPGEAEGLGVGHAAPDVGRAAHQLAIGVALPRRAAGVDDLVAHRDRVLAAG